VNDSNVDHLLHVVAPRSERIAPANLRDNERAPRFSDQLLRLSSPTADSPSRRPAQEYSETTTATGSSHVDSADKSPAARDDEERDTATESTAPATGDAPTVAEAPAAAATETQRDGDSPRETAPELSAAAEPSEQAAAAAPANTAGGESGEGTSILTAEVATLELDIVDTTATKSEAQISPEKVDGDGSELTLNVTAEHVESDVAEKRPGPSQLETNASELSADAQQEAEVSEITVQHELNTSIRGDEPTRRSAAKANEPLNQVHAPVIAENQLAVNQALATAEAPPTADLRESKQGDNTKAIASDRGDSHSKSAISRAQGAPVNTPALLDASAAAATTTLAGDVATPDASDDQSPQAGAVRQGRLSANLDRAARGGALAHGRQAGGADELSRADVERFVGRVSRAFHFAQERGGTLRLRLSPPELGSLRLELTLNDNVLSAKLEAETPATRRLLLDHLPALRDRLAEQNIRVEKFDVDVRRDGHDEQNSSENPRQHERPQHRGRQESPTWRPSQRNMATEPTTGQGDTEVVPSVGNSEINLVV
jgi:flagellar hook-length control protein FliK